MLPSSRALLGALVPLVCLPAAANLVTQVRELVARGEFALAERQVAEFRSRSGATVEVAEAVSWLGRGALAAKNYDRAERYAGEARTLALDLLKTRKLDDEKHLPLALGASIEVHAQVLADRGERDAAVRFLTGELARWRGTSVHERIQKNINLLSLEGKPAPPLAADKWLSGEPVTLASLRGKTVLLFLWAHWCGDCKGMVPTLAELERTYGPRGLVMVGAYQALRLRRAGHGRAAGTGIGVHQPGAGEILRCADRDAGAGGERDLPDVRCEHDADAGAD